MVYLGSATVNSGAGIERVQFSGNCCHSERSAKRGGEESAFDYVAEKQIPHFPDSRDRLFGMTFPQD